MDMRRRYYMILDTETANTYTVDGKLNTQDSLVYDLGFQIVDKKGNVYEEKSYIIYDVFFNMRDVMQSAYYATKRKKYIKEIAEGKRKIITYKQARQIIHYYCRLYKVKAICAHNAYFDYNALTKTQRYLSKSAQRYFFPYGIEIWDTLKMARSTICKQKSYIRFCEENGYMTKHKVPQPKATAEIIYRYISGEDNFNEEHTGLEDVKIETEIFAHCIAQHKKMKKVLFEG